MPSTLEHSLGYVLDLLFAEDGDVSVSTALETYVT
jgi:hypothetical protein